MPIRWQRYVVLVSPFQDRVTIGGMDRPRRGDATFEGAVALRLMYYRERKGTRTD